jgi:hypothetical protein
MKRIVSALTICLLVISSQLFTSCEEKKEPKHRKKPIGKLEQNGKLHPMAYNTKNGKIRPKEKKYKPVMTK